MKIKTWLLISYFVVMVLPLIAAYLLFGWIQSYNNEQKVTEHVETVSALQSLNQSLSDPKLYSSKTYRKRLDTIANTKQSIALFNPDGVVIYTSNPSFMPAHYGIGKQQLYEDLYSLERGYRTYTYKQPVFSENELVGFFHVELARDTWVAGVKNRSLLVGGLFTLVFILIYICIIRLVNKKLNRRLTGLMNEMTAFAAGNQVKEKPTNNDEIGKLTKHFYDIRRQINNARSYLEQEQQAKEYLIASVSHDLKTPLTSIKAYAESLQVEKDLSPSEKRDYQRVIKEKADFMQQMLDDLLTFTLLQSPKHDMELVEVDGSEFFEMLVGDYEPLCKKKKICLQAYADVQGLFEVNPKQMIRIADNLVSNAISHTPENGRIWIAAVSKPAKLKDEIFDFVDPEDFLTPMPSSYFIVQNEGKGIKEENLLRVFDPLYQVDEARSKRDAQGTGLGLSITKQIMEKHGGTVKLFSKEEVGTCVICVLPQRGEKIVNEGN
ncbi:HAMP domain-containing sensor histidine kinase [Virgibacillus halodenitrificans]|uniref:HAMP domain-containing sensor histidine kinase n=1 Tax=Virgibacillus halodenitrificans TaxID=1482 RepID=UPI001F1910EA|nr:HAMP domain-containing histidine kinase [Virgibacillus halodenitrificans]MCJ0933264.1 HAMP domain-containing histidine kinase [Virgibacillus halodenitrificans]